MQGISGAGRSFVGEQRARLTRQPEGWRNGYILYSLAFGVVLMAVGIWSALSLGGGTEWLSVGVVVFGAASFVTGVAEALTALPPRGTVALRVLALALFLACPVVMLSLGTASGDWVFAGAWSFVALSAIGWPLGYEMKTRGKSRRTTDESRPEPLRTSGQPRPDRKHGR